LKSFDLGLAQRFQRCDQRPATIRALGPEQSNQATTTPWYAVLSPLLGKKLLEDSILGLPAFNPPAQIPHQQTLWRNSNLTLL
jgi:hypothetical protein